MRDKETEKETVRDKETEKETVRDKDTEKERVRDKETVYLVVWCLSDGSRHRNKTTYPQNTGLPSGAYREYRQGGG